MGRLLVAPTPTLAPAGIISLRNARKFLVHVSLVTREENFSECAINTRMQVLRCQLSNNHVHKITVPVS